MGSEFDPILNLITPIHILTHCFNIIILENQVLLRSVSSSYFPNFQEYRQLRHKMILTVYKASFNQNNNCIDYIFD